MLIDTDSVSKWYVLNRGFKTYDHCSHCQSSKILFHKVREPGYAGILSRCQDCHKIMPTRMRATKTLPRRVKEAI